MRYMLLLSAATAIAACDWGSCANTVVDRVESPDGSKVAVLFTRGCGATTRETSQVSLLKAGVELPNQQGNVLVVNHETAVSAEWLGPGHLIVHVPQSAAIIEEVPSVLDVAVSFDRR